MVNIEITDPVVNDLTFGSPQGSSGTINAPTNMNWDCSIGDLTFLYGISDQYPFLRQTAEFRRQRIDTERNPGEQSLDSGYWLRSQQSWHYGSGLNSNHRSCSFITTKEWNYFNAFNSLRMNHWSR